METYENGTDDFVQGRPIRRSTRRLPSFIEGPLMNARVLEALLVAFLPVSGHVEEGSAPAERRTS
jgi:hypothetical protein